MVVPKINSAHGSDTRNIINRAIDLINIQGKSIQDLVAEGQLTPSQYAILIQAVNGLISKGNITTDDLDKNNFKIDQTMVDDELRKIMTGNAPINAVPADNSLTTNKYVDNSVTRDKRTVGGERASLLTWGVIPNIDLQNKKVEIYPKTEIVHSKGRSVLNHKVELNFYEDVYISVIVFDTLTESFEVIRADDIRLMTENEVFIMRISFENTDNSSVLDVICDSDYTIDGEKRVDKNSVHESSLSQNLTESIYSGDYLIDDYIIRQINPVNGGVISSDITVITDFIRVFPGNNIKLLDLELLEGFRIFYYSLDKVYKSENTRFLTTHSISDDCFIRIQSRYKDSRKINSPVEFSSKIKLERSKLNTIESMALYEDLYPIKGMGLGQLGIADGKEYSGDNRIRSGFIKVRKGYKVKMNPNDETPGIYLFKYDGQNKNFIESQPFSFEHVIEKDMYIRVQSRYNDNSAITDLDYFQDNIFIDKVTDVVFNKSPQLFGNFNALYKTKEIVDTDFIKNSEFTDVYSKYDEFMNQYSAIFSKKLYGYGTDSSGVKDMDLPIYGYTIKNPTTPVNGKLPNNSPTIMISCAIHGNEKTPPWATYFFIKQMLENFSENDVLSGIKSNVNFKIMPVCNPGGYNDVTYENKNGVNLNRNFGHNWHNTDPNDNDKGLSPYSEFESQAIRSWIEENVGENTIFIDFHNTGEEYGVTYLTAHEEELVNGYASLARRLTDLWKRRYNDQIDDKTYGFIAGNVYPTIYNEAYYNFGIKSSVLLEIAWNFKGVYHTAETFERGVDLLANYIQLTLRLYNEGLY